MRNDKNPKAEKDDPGPHVCLDSKNKFSMLVILDIFSLRAVSLCHLVKNVNKNVNKTFT